MEGRAAEVLWLAPKREFWDRVAIMMDGAFVIATNWRVRLGRTTTAAKTKVLTSQRWHSRTISGSAKNHSKGSLKKHRYNLKNLS